MLSVVVIQLTNRNSSFKLVNKFLKVVIRTWALKRSIINLGLEIQGLNE